MGKEKVKMKSHNITSECLSFRFINCQCFELRLPNGVSIVTDPCYDFPHNNKMQQLFKLEGFKTEDLKACDYVILNHTHGDHIANLGEVIARFSPKVICHTGVAEALAETYEDMELTSIYPVDYDGTYYFDGFRLDTFHGEHKPQRLSYKDCSLEGDVISSDPRLTRLHTLGGFFNMNYLLTLDNGFRIAFVGGNDDGMSERLRQLRPNISLRNKLANDMDVDKVAGEWFSFMKECHSQFVIPMHFEVWENLQPGFTLKSIVRANELAEEAGISVRLIYPERTKWYKLNMGFTSADILE